MTIWELRHHYAGQAMAALIIAKGMSNTSKPEGVAKKAFEYAAAMLEAKEKVDGELKAETAASAWLMDYLRSLPERTCTQCGAVVGQPDADAMMEAGQD